MTYEDMVVLVGLICLLCFFVGFKVGRDVEAAANTRTRSRQP